jgi:hypothetical protein
LVPAWKRVPRWRTMIEPARDDLTAERLDAQHLRLRVAAVPGGHRRLFFCAMVQLLTARSGVDRADLDLGEVLAMTCRFW